MSNAELSATLVIAAQTTKTHVGRILAKLGLRDCAQPVVLAMSPVSSALEDSRNEVETRAPGLGTAVLDEVLVEQDKRDKHRRC